MKITSLNFFVIYTKLYLLTAGHPCTRVPVCVCVCVLIKDRAPSVGGCFQDGSTPETRNLPCPGEQNCVRLVLQPVGVSGTGSLSSALPCTRTYMHAHRARGMLRVPGGAAVTLGQLSAQQRLRPRSATSAAAQGLTPWREGALGAGGRRANQRHSCWKRALLGEGHAFLSLILAELSRRPHLAWPGYALDDH